MLERKGTKKMKDTQDRFVWPEMVNPWKKASQPFKIAFWSACVLGVITHIYIFTNLLLNHDSAWRLSFNDSALQFGRWSLQSIRVISTKFEMPVVAAVITIIMLSLTAGFTIKILGIQNKTNTVLSAGFIVTFPSVACIFSYLYTADAYFICLFLNVFAVYLVKKYHWGWLPAIVLCAFACGGYQAFICCAIGLLLMDCILDLFTDRSIREIVGKGCKYIFIIISSLLLYYLILLVLLKVHGMGLTPYQGIDSMGIGNIKGFLAQIPTAYENFGQYFTASRYSAGFYQTVQVLFSALSFGALCYLAVITKLYRDRCRFALLLVGCLLLPLALNFITVISVEANVHALMIYAFVLQYVFMIKLIELALQRMIAAGVSDWPAMHLTGIILAGLLLWNNFCVSNMAYLRLQVTYENSFALANRIAARIEILDGYAPNLPVAIVGEASRSLYGGTISDFSQINSLSGTNDWLLYSPEPHVRTREYIKTYIGLRMPEPSDEQKAFISESGILDTMGSYPDQTSVQMYEGIIIVKLSDGPVV